MKVPQMPRMWMCTEVAIAERRAISEVKADGL
jgi:hypothetical protein